MVILDPLFSQMVICRWERCFFFVAGGLRTRDGILGCKVQVEMAKYIYQTGIKTHSMI